MVCTAIRLCFQDHPKGMFLRSRVLLARLPVPEAKKISAMTLKRFWYILIQNGFRWTAEELKKVTDMLSRPLVRGIMEDPIFKGNQNYMVN